MKIGIVGAGAIGLAFASLLSKEHEVAMVCRREEHAEALEYTAVTDVGNLGKIDFFILATKAHDSEKALEGIRASYPKTPVVALQNGLVHFEDPHVMRGITTYAAIRKGDTESLITAEGEVFLEKKKGSKKILNAFDKAGINTRLAEGLGGILWEKFFINVGINALGAATGKTNGELVQDKQIRNRMKRLVGEAVFVSQVGQDPQSVFHRVIDAAIQTGENKNSMLQDIEAGRKTEIEYLNGAVHSLGELRGVEMPENRAILDEIKRLEG